MKRRLLNFLTGLSLLLFAATCALWARSGVVGDEWTLKLARRSVMLRSDWGRLTFAVMNDRRSTQLLIWQRTGGGYHDALPGLAITQPPELLGICYRAGTFTYSSQRPGVPTTGTYHWLRIYHPHALLLLAVLPAIHLLRSLGKRRRAAAGLCPRCGYDLRATPDKCPECGTTGSVNIARHIGSVADGGCSER